MKTSQLQLADALAECQHLKVEHVSLQEQLEEAQAAAHVSSILNQELEEKESKITHILGESMLHFYGSEHPMMYVIQMIGCALYCKKVSVRLTNYRIKRGLKLTGK